ncbi:MAG: phosphoglycerate dehydrogenase [Caldiserica bacterium]|nr:MAG: phosphoglycerate dehydrogenase [Caldisericota bacterium]
MVNVLVLDNIKEEQVLDILKEDFNLDFRGKLKEDDLISIVENYDAILLRSGTKITKNVLEKAKNLKVIGRAGVGVDNIDVEEATRKGIIVMNVPSGNTISACEHTFALILSLLRKIPQADRSMREGRWDRKSFTGQELYGKTIGIIGLGRIGREVAKRAISFGMRVIGYDPFVSKEYFEKMGVEIVSLDELLKNSDIVTLHVALTDDTRYLINRETLSIMKKDAFIVNVSRGAVINEKDLFEFLKEGRIKGAALDVYEKEPPEELPFKELENVILTPHLGASTVEAQERVSFEIAKQIRDYFLTNKITNAVNFPVKEISSEIGQFMLLSEKIGKAFIQLEGDLNNVELIYSRGLLEENRGILTSCFFKGALSQVLDVKVSVVNSMLFARERNINWRESIVENEDYRNLLTVKGDKVSISGTTFHNEMRFVEINGYPVSIVPDGVIILFSNKDTPGVIGKVGTILGKRSINIARMEVGRREKGGDAITCVKVDSSPDEETLTEISKLPFVGWIKKVEL